MFTFGIVAVSLVLCLGLIQNWFWALPVVTATVLCLSFGKAALVPALAIGFLLDVLVALAVGYVTAVRGKAVR